MYSKRQKLVHNPQGYGSSLRADDRIVRATIHGVGTLSSSAGGSIATAIQMDPNTLPSTDFSDFGSAYDEFRVLGCRLRLVPLLQNDTKVAALNNLMIVAFDNDSHANPTSYTTTFQYSTSVVTSAIAQCPEGKVFEHLWWRPSAGAETNIPWIDVNTSSGSDGSILIYADTLTASTGYLAYTVELFVEFRGRR